MNRYRLLFALLVLTLVAFAPKRKSKAKVALELTPPEKTYDLGHDGMIHDAAFSPDGRYLATAGADRVAQIWDLNAGLVVRRLPHPHEVKVLVWGPQGQMVTAGRDGAARLWDLETTTQIHELVVGGTHVDYWDVAGPSMKGELMKLESKVLAVAWAKEKQFIAGGDRDAQVRVWNASTLEEISGERKLTSWVHSVAISDDGSRIVGGDRKGQVCLWDDSRGAEPLCNGNGSGQVNGLALFPKAGFLAVTADGAIDRWSVNGDALTLDFSLVGHGGTVTEVILVEEGRALSAGGDGTVRLWDLTSQEELKRYADRQ